MLYLYGMAKTLFNRKRASEGSDKGAENAELSLPQKVKKRVKINKRTFCTTHVHDTKRDFPVSGCSKYDEVTRTNITLDFCNKRFKLPGCFMHYIDDIEAIGWSWIPPADFIQCLQQGYDALFRNHAPEERIGYLVIPKNFLKEAFEDEENTEYQELIAKYEPQKIYDTHGKDSYLLNIRSAIVTPAEVSKKMELAPDVLEALRHINKKAQELNSDQHFHECEYEILMLPSPLEAPPIKKAKNC